MCVCVTSEGIGILNHTLYTPFVCNHHLEYNMCLCVFPEGILVSNTSIIDNYNWRQTLCVCVCVCACMHVCVCVCACVCVCVARAFMWPYSIYTMWTSSIIHHTKPLLRVNSVTVFCPKRHLCIAIRPNSYVYYHRLGIFCSEKNLVY